MSDEGAMKGRMEHASFAGLGRSRLLLYLAAPLAAVLLLVCFPPRDRWGPGIPPGDVAIDAATAGSLAAGHGFWTPWERGSAFRVPRGEERNRFGHAADQHPPLWPLAGALFMRLFGLPPFEALRWASFCAHLAVLLLMTAAALRLAPGGWAVLPGLCYALSSLGAAFSFNGSLYAAQAALTLAAALLAARPRSGTAGGFLLGITCGAAWLVNYQAILLMPAALAAGFLARRGRAPGPHPHGRWTAAVFAGALLTAAPWLARNLLCFGSPWWTVNTYYLAAKAGAAFTHHPAEGVLLLQAAPVSAGAWLQGLLRWTAQNLPFLALGLLVTAPGAAAAVLLLDRGGRRKEKECTVVEGEFSRTLLLVLAVHLAVCILWPALKIRYLAPALPLVLLLAFHAVREGFVPSPRRAAAVTVLSGLFCGAAWWRGGTHGQEVGQAFLLFFLPAVPILCLPRWKEGPFWFRRLPLPSLLVLVLLGAGTRPGGAYFNLAPWTDFFGEDKDAREGAAGEELPAAAARLDAAGARRVIGDPRLFYAGHDLQVVTPPLRLEEEVYGAILRRAARLHAVRYALLSAGSAEVLPQGRGIRKVWSGRWWVLLDLFPEGR